MTVLIIDGSRSSLAFLHAALAGRKYSVATAEDSSSGAALAAACNGHLEAILMDTHLRGHSGFDLCRSLRRRGHEGPVIMVSREDDVSNRARGLAAGADDYVVKPYQLDELLARMEVQIARYARQEEQSRLTVGDVTLNRKTGRLIFGDSELGLTPREASLMALLMREPGTPQSADDLAARLREESTGRALIDGRFVRLYISYLRRKLHTARIKRSAMIATIRNRGYMVDPEFCSAAE